MVHDGAFEWRVLPIMPPVSTAVRRKRGPRFNEIAEAAGVSQSTVNRVLNERGSVSAETRARVLAAAKRLGVPRLLPDNRRGLIRFDVIIAGNNTPYFQRLNLAFQHSMQLLDKKVVIHRTFIPEDADDDTIARTILAPRHKRHGLIVAVHDCEKVRQALRQVIQSGVAVVTLMSDIADVPRIHYAGIDNYRAGRTAGYMLGRFARGPGRILVLTNSLDYQAHADRVRGLATVMADTWPALQVTPPLACHDEDDQCYAAVLQALRLYPDLLGIYNSGAGTPGIVAALRKAGVAGRVLLAGHELSAEHRQFIDAGIMDLVIDQDPDGQTLSGIQHLLYACGLLDLAPATEPNEFRLFCRENAGP